MKKNYIIIPLAVLAVALSGGWFTSFGINSGWYEIIAKPAWTPSGSVIGTVWTIIFILGAFSALLFWNSKLKSKKFSLTVCLFIANGVLNTFWSFLFFYKNLMGWAVLESALLELTIIGLIFLMWRPVRASAMLLLPYAGWVVFATFLTYKVWSLN